jgi:hypothetical protein
MEPFVCIHGRRCNRVTIHFDHFEDAEERSKITNGYYIHNRMMLKYPLMRVQSASFVIPCESLNLPQTEYSHILAIQHQHIIHQQTEQIQRLEERLNEMEMKLHESTELYVDRLSSQLKLKLGYQGVIRRVPFTISASADMIYNNLCTTATSLFGFCQGSTLRFTYLDEDEDEISIISCTELQIALDIMNSTGRGANKFDIHLEADLPALQKLPDSDSISVFFTSSQVAFSSRDNSSNDEEGWTSPERKPATTLQLNFTENHK